MTTRKFRQTIKPQVEVAPRRAGIRIRGERGDVEVTQALIRYAKWLRRNYPFPVRVPIYLFPTETITTSEGEIASASFFAPFDRKAEPHVRIATGDYQELKNQQGRDNALAAFIVSLNHELVHYYQWLKTGTTSERNVVRRAVRMLRRYESAVDHP